MQKVKKGSITNAVHERKMKAKRKMLKIRAFNKLGKRK